jgi:hypothetical protein
MRNEPEWSAPCFIRGNNAVKPVAQRRSSGDTSKVTEVGGGYDFTTGMFGQVGVIGDFWNLGGTYNFCAETWNGFVGFTSFEFEAVTPELPI